ncbi:MAG: exopolyphosphatase, partial [Lachnospiraceae bacterium]|nr:exopolyphosphatase [Lachnospiraceae bacterium]
MAVKTFAAIDIGSYELSMKIFEISKAKGMKEVDHIRYSIDMGTETYTTGKLSYQRVEELCRILRAFSDVMKTYQVSDYVAYGTSAIRETENTGILLDQIRQRTGIKIDVLSNSEQRFLDYKSIASQGEEFRKVLERPTAILDIGGGSIQVSLFENDTLVSTQNINMGVLRLRESLTHLDASVRQYETLLGELLDSRLEVYKKLYLKDRTIENIIVMDDYISPLLLKEESGYSRKGYGDKARIDAYLAAFRSQSISGLARQWDMPEENMLLIYITLIMTGRIMDVTGARQIWAPGVT